jgi:hypothetical protein
MRIHMVKKISFEFDFYQQINIPLLKRILKIKWTNITDFQFNNNNYYILAYDMNQPVPPAANSCEFPE